MNKLERTGLENAWLALRKKVEEDIISDSLGLDLLRGLFLDPYSVMEHLHFQIFGKEEFLRNMLQRILIWDLTQYVPVFVITPQHEPSLLEEITKIFSEESSRRNTLFLYSRLRPKISIKINHLPYLFEEKWGHSLDLNHLYMELDEKDCVEERTLLNSLSQEIIRRYPVVEDPWRFKPRKPFVYLYYPEKLKGKFSLDSFIEQLKDHVSFRILSENLLLFDYHQASHIYGPHIFPAKTYEDMREECCKRFPKNDKPYYSDDSQYRNELKIAKELARTIPAIQTAFARFRKWSYPGYEYSWFYPVRQNLGQLAYQRPLQNDSAESVPAKKDPLADIINDLKPGK